MEDPAAITSSHHWHGNLKLSPGYGLYKDISHADTVLYLLSLVAYDKFFFFFIQAPKQGQKNKKIPQQ